MSSLRSALEEWEAEDVDQLHLDQLVDDLVELEVISGVIEAERLRRIANFERRGGPNRYGYPSLTAFLKHRCRMATGRAHRMVARSRAFMTAISTFRAWRGGRLSTDQAVVLLDQATSVPEPFAEAEPTLIEACSALTVSDTKRAVGYWRQAVDGPGTTLSEIQEQEMRGLSLSESLNGMYRVDGWMTRLAGEAFRTAVEAFIAPPDPDDVRGPRQRRHDALEDLARHYLDHGDTPTIGGEKPHVNLICDIPALQGIAGGLHETENGTVLTITELRMITCDCSLSRIVFGPESEVIDVGRRTRTIPTAIRRAVIARDRHCTWPHGCDRDPRWCDVHHIQHWADLGETEPGNLTLLCRWHHTLTHLQDDSGPGTPPGWTASSDIEGVSSTPGDTLRDIADRRSRSRVVDSAEQPERALVGVEHGRDVALQGLGAGQSLRHDHACGRSPRGDRDRGDGVTVASGAEREIDHPP